ncbi:MAG TPA: porin [Janthinobacterium sp.]|nr:porin [Janthinobacterium sp.]
MNGAFAQTAPSSIEIYGVFDIGIGHSTHSPSEDYSFPTGMTALASRFGDRAVTGMFNGGITPSRIGFRGTEDLGNGIKAVFNLETAFQPQHGTFANALQSLQNNTSSNQTTVAADSSLSGQLFNRQANVGLTSDTWGTVLVGRNYTLGLDTMIVYDPMDGSQVFSPFGYSGSYAGGGFTENYRVDNSVRWKYISKEQGWNAGVLYKFGGQSGSTSAQSIYQLTAGYANGPFGVQASYVKAKDAFSVASGATLGALNLTVADTTGYMIAAGYKWNAWNFRGGYEKQKFDNPSNPELDRGITSVLGAPVALVNVTAFTHQRQYDVYFAGVNYDFSEAFVGKIAYYQVNQNDYSAGGCTTGVNVASCGGKNRFYSLLGDYGLSKRTHLYAGFMFNRVAGGFASGFLHNTNNLVGAGVKHTF